MVDLKKIWKLRAYIPDPTTPPVLYRNSDAEDVERASINQKSS